MARTSSIFNAPLTGNLGNQTLKNYSGTQVAVSRFRTTSAKGEGASYEQRLTRLQLPNLVLAGSQLKKWLPCLFEPSRYHKTAYTRFLAHNKVQILPCISKGAAERKLSHWGPMEIASGSLPRISCECKTQDFISSLSCDYVPGGTYKTLGDVSKDIIRNNVGWQDGDYLFIVSCRTTGVGTIDSYSAFSTTPSFGYIRLDSNSSVNIDSAWNGSTFYLLPKISSSMEPCWGLHVDSDEYSIGFVHVRHKGSVYFSSPCNLTLGNGVKWFYQVATSDECIEACARSYGYKEPLL